MKLVKGKIHDKTFIGILINKETQVLDIQRAEEELYENKSGPILMVDGIEKNDKWIEHLEQIIHWSEKERETVTFIYDLKDVILLAPIERPKKNIICVGKNYQRHAQEMGSLTPEHLVVFSKSPTAIIGPGENICLHSHITKQVDYEGELAVVIGKKGRAIKEEDAMDYVFGYTILNDITARDLQANHQQFLLSKSLDTFCPIGPYIVHKSAIMDPNRLSLKTYVNGELRQSAYVSEMMFNIPQMISIISRGMTLEVGDIIATGTPAGVGKGFNPPKYLSEGDKVEIEVEGIGVLSNSLSS
ncbi:fumarylacetoacetate hydrolase family protein [Bacillus carboniphilus]|uniref:Fumarylacetoacetate hydrolase family protein n=1 Tax=Bacillus carboniphilus TaxID=86663 RepID=A0ABY9JU33_9BACI|nr:fumarylacetoacetate hydrolase family protein [Bacillus carboniphilus]WLR42911.1 fumarylacetoacetate hydrolase family protein [Bacillus carboniphilus]